MHLRDHEAHMQHVIERIATVAIIMGAAGAMPASAQEICIACQGPQALYRCVIENSGPSPGVSYKVACISALAREGGHEACAVKAVTVLECDAPIKRVNVAGEAPVVTGTGSAQALAVKPASPDEPPKTVEEALRRASKSTADGVSKAGNATGEAAKKTWNCVTSLFKSC